MNQEKNMGWWKVGRVRESPDAERGRGVRAQCDRDWGITLFFGVFCCCFFPCWKHLLDSSLIWVRLHLFSEMFSSLLRCSVSFIAGDPADRCKNKQPSLTLSLSLTLFHSHTHTCAHVHTRKHTHTAWCVLSNTPAFSQGMYSLHKHKYELMFSRAFVKQRCKQRFFGFCFWVFCSQFVVCMFRCRSRHLDVNWSHVWAITEFIIMLWLGAGVSEGPLIYSERHRFTD